MEMKVSVIIPQYNNYALLHQVLFDLYKACKQDIDEVLVVDDKSTDGTVEKGLQWWFKQEMLPIKAIWKTQNDGFLKTCNVGIEKADGDIVILLSNDVRVYDNFVAWVKALISNDEKILVGNRLIDWSSGWNNFGDKIFPYLEGWLLACTKSTWNKLGGFDERYGSSDFEDVDLSTTAKDMGYSLISMDNAKVVHIGGQSYGFNPTREERTKKNRELFRRKWVDKDG